MKDAFRVTFSPLPEAARCLTDKHFLEFSVKHRMQNIFERNVRLFHERGSWYIFER